MGRLFWLLRGDDETAALCEMIIALLIERPCEWEFCGFHARHQSGIDVWIANQSYGLHVQHGRTEITPRWWWRRGIWKAAKAHRARAIREQMVKEYTAIKDNVVSITSAGVCK